MATDKLNRRQGSLFDGTFSEEAEALFNPDLIKERYGRQWRLSKPTIQDGHLFGKLGFEHRAPSSHVKYDTDMHDFIEIASPLEQGNFVMFVIDLNSRIIAFEERRPDIRVQSFIGALTGILSQAGSTWDLDLLADEMSFDQWIRDVDRITKFRATILQPNPSPRRRAAEIRDLISEPNADRLSVEAVADEQRTEGLSVEGTLLGAVAEHAADGNGSFKASGFKQAARTFFDSTRKSITRALSLPSDSSTEALNSLISEKLSDVVAEYQSRASADE